MEARQADWEAMDESAPQGAVKIRNWHQKQVDAAKAALKEAEEEKKEKGMAVAAAEARVAQLRP